MLSISHFSKTYPGGKRAVDDLSMEVRPGEIMGFIGHDGRRQDDDPSLCGRDPRFHRRGDHDRRPLDPEGAGGGQVGYRLPAG